MAVAKTTWKDQLQEEEKKWRASIAAGGSALPDWTKANAEEKARGYLASTVQTEKTTEAFKPTTANQIYARIAKIRDTDPAKATELMRQTALYRITPGIQGNLLYSPYHSSTIDGAREVFNTDNFDQDFINRYAWLRGYTVYTNDGNLKAPTKDFTDQQIAAYWYAKVAGAESDTQAAEKEWATLRNDIAFLVQSNDKKGATKVSDAEIYNQIIEMLDSGDYKTLNKIRTSPDSLVLLNRSLDFDSDAIYAAMQAARDKQAPEDFDYFASGAKYENSREKQEAEFAKLQWQIATQNIRPTPQPSISGDVSGKGEVLGQGYVHSQLTPNQIVEETGMVLPTIQDVAKAREQGTYNEDVIQAEPAYKEEPKFSYSQQSANEYQSLIDNAISTGAWGLRDDLVQKYQDYRRQGYSFWQMDMDTMTPYEGQARGAAFTDDSDSKQGSNSWNFDQWAQEYFGLGVEQSSAGETLGALSVNKLIGGTKAVVDNYIEMQANEELPNAFFEQRKNVTDKRDSAAEVQYMQDNPLAYMPELSAKIRELSQSNSLTTEQAQVVKLLNSGVALEDIINPINNVWIDRKYAQDNVQNAANQYSVASVLSLFGLGDFLVTNEAAIMNETAQSNAASLALGNAGLAAQIAGEFITEVPPMLVSMGLWFVPGLGPVLSAAYNASRLSGEYIESSRQEGAGKDARDLMGLVGMGIGALEAIPVGQILGKAGKVATAISKVANLSSQLGRFGDTALSALEEGTQEGLEDVVFGLFAKLIYDKNRKIVSTQSGERAVINLPDTLQSIAIGGILGGLMDVSVDFAQNVFHFNSPQDAISYLGQPSPNKNMALVLTDPSTKQQYVVTDKTGRVVITDAITGTVISDIADGSISLVDMEGTQLFQSIARSRYVESAEVQQDVSPETASLLQLAQKGRLTLSNATVLQKGVKEFAAFPEFNKRIQGAASSAIAADKAEKAAATVVESATKQEQVDREKFQASSQQLEGHIQGIVEKSNGQTLEAANEAVASARERYDATRDFVETSRAAGVDSVQEGTLDALKADLETKLGTLRRAFLALGNTNNFRAEYAAAQNAYAQSAMAKQSAEANLAEKVVARKNIGAQLNAYVNAITDQLVYSRVNGIAPRLQSAASKPTQNTKGKKAAPASPAVAETARHDVAPEDIAPDAQNLPVDEESSLAEQTDTEARETPVQADTEATEDDEAFASLSAVQNPIPPNTSPSAAQNIRTTNKAIRSLQQQMEEIADDLGIGLQTGSKRMRRGTHKTVLGYYSVIPPNRGINVRMESNIATFFHEVGHDFDARYNISTNMAASLNNLQQRLNITLASSYSPQQVPGEIVAEVIRNIFADPEFVSRSVGKDFLDTFFDMLTDEDRRIVKKGQRAFAEFNGATTGQKIQASYHNIGNPKSKVGFFDTVITKCADDLFRTVRFDMEAAANKQAAGKGDLLPTERVEFAAKATRQSLSQSNSLLSHHLSNPDNTQRLGNSFFDNFVDYSGPKPQDYLKSNEDVIMYKNYDKAKHALDDWKALGKAVFFEGTGGRTTGAITEAEARAYVLDVETYHPNVIQVHQNVINWWKTFMQAWVVDEGFVSQATFNQWLRDYPNYSPNFRVMGENLTTGTESGEHGRTDMVARSSEHGSTADTYDPLQSRVMLIYRYVRNVNTNRVYRTLFQDATSLPGLSAWAMPANKTMDAHTFNIEQTLIDSLPPELRGNTAIEDTITALSHLYPDGQATSFSVFRTGTGRNVLNAVMPSGQIQTMEVMDAPLLHALVGLMTPHNPDESLTLLRKLVNISNSLITTKNPQFAVRNMFRDLGTFIMNSPALNPIKIAKAYGQAFSALHFSKSQRISAAVQKARDAYLSSGGYQSSFSGQREELGAGIIEQKAAKKYIITDEDTGNVKVWANIAAKASMVANTLQTFGENIEATARFANFLLVTEAYGVDRNGIALASRSGKVGTTDFSTHGSAFANTIFLFRFANAAIQGTYQGVRLLFDNSDGGMKNRRIKLAVAMAAGILGALAEQLLWGQDEEWDIIYRDIPDSVKMRYTLIPMFWEKTKGNYLRIPKGQGLVLDIAQFGRVMAEGVMDDTLREDLKHWILYCAANDLAPVDNFILSPIADVLRNQAWSGYSIVPGYMEDVDNGLQYTESTDQWVINLSNTINGMFAALGEKAPVSPMKLQYLLSQYGGFPARAAGMISSVAEQPSEGLREIENYLWSTITLNGYTSSEIKTKYRDLKDALNAVQTSYRNNLPLAVLNSSLTKEERVQAIVELNALLDGLNEQGDAQGNGMGENAFINQCYTKMQEIKADTTMNAREKNEAINDLNAKIFWATQQGYAKMEAWAQTYSTDIPDARNISVYNDANESAKVDKIDVQVEKYFSSLPASLTRAIGPDTLDLMEDYFRATESMVYTIEWPPSFTQGEDVTVSWDKVTGDVQSAMQEAYAATLTQELAQLSASNDEEEAKKIVSAAKRKANAKARKIYDKWVK